MSIEDRQYMEATYQKIIRPQLAPAGKKFNDWITHLSPIWQRRAVVQLTRYLSKEINIRQDMDVSGDSWIKNNTSVYAVTDDIWLKNGDGRQALVGIVTFHVFNRGPVLYHCYLHPFYRHKNMMLEPWAKIKDKFKKFEIEPPISKSMQGFLSKVDSAHVLPPK